MKGYFSVFTAALVAFVLVFAAGAGLQVYGYHQAAEKDLQAKLLADIFQDISKPSFLERVFDDALLDYTYYTDGCAPALGDNSFCEGSLTADELVSEYYGDLSDAFPQITVLAELGTLDCQNVGGPAVPIGGVAYTRHYKTALPISLTINSSSATLATPETTLERHTYYEKTTGSPKQFYLRVYDENDYNGADPDANLIKFVSVNCDS